MDYRFLPTVSAIAVMAFSAPANAQVDAATPAEPVVTAPEEGQSGATATGEAAQGSDIIVTATKRAQTLQEVPISLAAVSGAEIAERGMRQFTDLQAGVPNLQIDQTNGNYAITIRGLGSGASNLAFEQSVGLFVDGVYSGRARSLQTSFLDVERVEIVRGPQGALFGKNTNAGAISLISRAPTRDFQAEVRGGYELEHDGWTASSYLSGPVSDALAARLTVSAGRAGPYMENRLTGEDQYSNSYLAARGQVRWEPTNNFDGTLKVEWSKNDVNGGNIVFNNLGTCTLCNLARTRAGGPGVAQESPGFFRTSLSSRPEFNDTQTSVGVWTMNLDIGDFKLTSITSYQDVNADQQIDTDVGALTLLDVNQRERSNQFFQEVRLAGNIGDRLDVLGGITYISSDLLIRQLVFYNGTPNGVPTLNGNSNRTLDQTGDSISPYLALDYDVTDHVQLSSSLRYSRETKSADISQINVGSVPATNLPYSLNGKRKEGLWDYSAKARYQFSRKAQVYLSYATGTKGGGFISNDGLLRFNIINSGATIDFKPERAKSWELGGKFKLLENRGDLNVALFTTDFENLQVSSFTGTSFTTGNAAKARSRGVEVETNWRPTDHFGFGGTIAYLDAKYLDYPGAACQFNAPPTCVAATNNVAGTVLTRAPKWKASGYLRGSVPVTEDLELSGRVSADYTARSFYQGDLNPLNSQPGYTKFDARLALKSDAGRWDIAVIGRNLANKVTFSQAFNVPLIGGNTHGVVINSPRTIAIEVSKQF